MYRVTDSIITPVHTFEAVEALENLKRYVQLGQVKPSHRMLMKVVEHANSFDSDRSVDANVMQVSAIAGQRSRVILLIDTVVMHDITFCVFDLGRRTCQFLNSEEVVNLMTSENGDQDTQLAELLAMTELIHKTLH